MTRSKPAASRPRHASPSLLAPTRSLLAVVAIAVLAALGIAGCAAMTGSPTISSRPHAGGPSVPHLALDRAVAAQPVAFRAADIAAAVSDPRSTARGGAVHRARTTAAPALDPTTPSALAGSGIPTTALAAYKRAAVREAARRPACGLVWPLLAAIGRVESNHGRFAGAVLHTDGYSTPRIVGIALNGHGTALIRDTDGGRLDGDPVFDRAVGPMQFIPSTWAGWGVDANHDGRADPNNIFDATAAAADYLCAAGRNLRTYAGQVQAVRSYNNSDAYIVLVLGLEKAYASGAVGVTIPVLPTNPNPGAVHAPRRPKLPPVDPGTPRGIPAKPKLKPTPGATSSTPSRPTSTAPGASSAPPPATCSTPGGGTSSQPPNGTPSTDLPSGSSSSTPPPSNTPSSVPATTNTSSGTSPPTSTTSACATSASATTSAAATTCAAPTTCVPTAGSSAATAGGPSA